MDVMHFILFKKNGSLRVEGECHIIKKNYIVVADQRIITGKQDNDDAVFIRCYPADLLHLRQDIIFEENSLTDSRYANKILYRSFPIDSLIIESTEKLMRMANSLPSCFLYLYCLGIDKCYFSHLLRQFVGVNMNNTLLDFFEQNYLKQWAVARYARELGISPPKLNVVFYQQYGMPIKQWLMEKRLKKSGELLLTTTLRVADIALECGFSSHAHFSALFRRRFQICPSLFRTMAKKTAK
ncbi:helix-turn-helix transcriptional regulator [Sodalis sp. RH24]|uniref:helix-turn-helix transcriptional regulator n=1 Tax=unclassified Sodalis (in: enterobacteria) TaxID=2636512 RepID=UPI003965D5A7